MAALPRPRRFSPSPPGAILGAALLLALLQMPAVCWAQAASVTPPQGFLGIRIGMTLGEVKAALAREPLFYYRGEPDLSLLPATRQALIEVPGRAYVERAYFQFHDDRLLSVIVHLSRELVSYFDVYSQLASRYGDATSIDPASATWIFPSLKLSLEKPVVLKYVDRLVFDTLTSESAAGTDWEEESRQSFLERL